MSDRGRAAPPNAALRVHRVGMSLGGSQVLVDLDLEIKTGVTGLLGPNGAGKTTLLRCVRTEIRPTQGRITILGLDSGKRGDLPAIRRQMGSLPQDFGYYPNFTLEEFVSYCGWLKQIPRARLHDRVMSALDQTGLLPQLRMKLGHLSGGQRRRAGIAQAVVNEPQLLILDEPTSGLDPEQRVQFRAMLRAISADRAVLMATHLAEDASQVCDRVAVLASGRIVFDGTTDHLLELGAGAPAGDTPLERGYLVALERGGPRA